MIRSILTTSLNRIPQFMKVSICSNTSSLFTKVNAFNRNFSTETESVQLPTNLGVDSLDLFKEDTFESLDPFKIQVKNMPILSLFHPITESMPESIILRNDVFGVPIRPDILHRCIVWQQAKKRAGNHKTKSRGEVSGSNRKILQQKGSGNARAGQSRSNIRRHGYKAMGPKLRSYDYTLPYRVRALGLRVALTTKWSQKQLSIITDCNIDTFKSNAIYKALESQSLANDTCLILDGIENNTFLTATRNIQKVNYLPVAGANVFDIMKNKNLIITKSGLEALYTRLEPYI